MLKKNFFLLLTAFIFTALSLSATTNTWNGSFNSYWHNNNNWSQGHIPTSTEDVVIPSGVVRYPNVDFYDEECNSLTINTGASLLISDQTLTVDNDITVYGTINMNNNASKLYCNDITWASGSSADMVGSSTIYLNGTWEFSSGAEVFLDAGYVDFYGSSISYIRSKDDNSYFNHIRDSKAGSYLSNSGLSNQPLRIHGNLYIYNNCGLQSVSSNSIELNGFINNMNGYIHMQNGTFVFAPVSAFMNYFQTGDYFHNVEINTSSVVIFDDPIEIKNNLTITSGTLNPSDNTITIGGNWSNYVGDSGFSEGAGTVVFNGSAHQYCSDEIFNILEINKPSGAFRLNGTTVTCATYDWTTGAVDVLSGTFTANDLADSGIYGNWYLNSGGTINLYQDNGQYTDLNGNLHIFGGNFNVYGGNGSSYWPYAADASIEMSGGTLDFVDNGIYIYNSSTYSFSENITGGTIRTSGSITMVNANFTPTGGTIELYGGNDATINQSSGSIYNLIINKSTTRNEKDYMFNRDGSKTRLTRSNTISLVADLSVDNDVTIESGTFNLNGHSVTISNNLDIYGTLQMTNASDNLTVNREFSWKSGSSDNITTGNITSGYFVRFELGTNATLDTGSTLTFTNLGTTACYMINEDSDATFGNVIVNSDELHLSTSMNTVRVVGDFTVNAGKNVYLDTYGYYNLEVSGTTSIANTASLSIDSGSFTCDSALNLEGDITLDSGTININNDFDIASTGSLTINGGTFTEAGSTICNIDGNLTISGGELHIYQGINFGASSSSSISGGNIYTYSLWAPYSGVLQATGGKITLLPSGNPLLGFHTDNYFYDLEVNALNSSSGIKLDADVNVHNNLDITQGSIDLNGHSLSVASDMTVSGELRMQNAADNLSVVNQLTFDDSATSDITSGTISTRYIEASTYTNASLGLGNTLTITASSGTYGYLVIRKQDFTLGNLIVDNTAGSMLLGILDTLQVLGNMTINSGCSLDIDTYAMRVDGTTDIPNTASISVTTGSLTNNGNLTLGGDLSLNGGNVNLNAGLDIASTATVNVNSGTFTANDLLNNGIYGNWYLNTGGIINLHQDNAGTQYVDLNGNLHIYGGNFNVYGGNGSSYWPYAADASIEMSDGTLDFIDNGIYIFNSSYYTLNENITGGTIKTSGGVRVNNANFTPTGGTIELYSANDATINQGLGAIHNLVINKSATRNENDYIFNRDGSKTRLTRSNSILLVSDLTVDNDMTIENGTFNLNGHSANVTNDLDIYGTLQMTNVSDNLTVNHALSWKSGSSDNINAGNITTGYVYKYEAGTNAALDTGSTLIFSNFGTSTSYMINQDADATFGNVIANNTSLKFNTSSGIINVLGDFTVNAGKHVYLNQYSLNIHGTLDIENTASLDVTSGSLTNDSDLNLAGDMSLAGGNIDINAAFDIAATGSLTISVGTFSEAGSGTFDIYGNLTMSAGSLNSTESIYLRTGATTNITGGTITTPYFSIADASQFQATAGTFILNSNAGHSTLGFPANNYFYNLIINTTNNGYYELGADLTVNNNFTIQNGDLEVQNHTLNVANDIIINDELTMSDASGIINAGTDNNNSITWENGSTANISAGRINNFGNWIFKNGCNANFTGGTVNFVGANNATISNLESTNSSFYNLNSNKGTGNYLTFNSDGNSEPLRIAGNLTNTDGTFYINNGEASIGGIVNVESDELRLDENTILKIGTALNVNNTGTLNAIATSGNEIQITSNSSTDYFDFNVNNGGTISAEYVSFERMSINGVNIKTGAAIDPSYPMNHCTFKDGENSGTLLTINNDQVLTIDNCTFIAGAAKDATYNVSKTVDTGRITFTNTNGTYAGPDYESDPNNRIDWTGFAPDLTITNVSYSDTNPYLADLVTVTVVIKNLGNAKIYSNQAFYIDYFNNETSAPVIGDIGNSYKEVNREITPNDTIHVFLNISNNVAESWNSYLIVDTDDLIAESNEGNNISGPYALTWQELPAVSDLQITLNGNDADLTWNYPITADSYKIYRTTDPYNYGGATVFTSTIKRYTDVNVSSSVKYFYLVTAVRNYPPSKSIITKEAKEKRKHLINSK